MGLSIHKIVDAPIFINERLLTLRISLVKGEYAAILSYHAPALTGEKNLMNSFYEQLPQAPSENHETD